MSIQQTFMETISRNIANAATTRGANGAPYQRQIAVIETDPVTGAPVTRIVTDTKQGELTYNPGHPDADESGYVLMPNVDVSTETVDLMIARRLHEANATVFEAAKSMLRRSLEI